MTKKEAVQILAILKAAYPSSYNGMTKEEASGTVGIWAMQFESMPVDIVMMAVQKLIATNKFPPTIAEVKDKIKAIHWEAYDFAHGWESENLSEEARNKFRRIYEATNEYRHGRAYEPQLRQMLAFGELKQIGNGE